MNTTPETTTQTAFALIMSSDIFRLDGPAIDLPQAIISLCNAISEEDETDWSLGEGLECSLSDLIPAAHWCLTQWHAGQSSESYAALCATGSIFSPGMADGPEPESSEMDAYNALSQWFADNTGKNLVQLDELPETQTPKTWNHSPSTAPHFQGQVYNEDGKTIALTYHDEDGSRAKLIAAAPDLLEALAALTQELSQHDDFLAYSNGCINDKLSDARAAIEQATN